MNPLEHVLSMLSVQWVVTTPLHAGGRWALAFDGRLDLRVEVVARGSCWVVADGEPLRAEQGDCYVIVGRRRYRLASDLDAAPVPALGVYTTADGLPRELARVGEGHDTTLVGAGFTCAPDAAPLLFDVLPPLIHVPAGDQAAVLRTTIDLLAHEAEDARLGRTMMVDRLAQVLLLHALRGYAATSRTSGWLVASLHPQLGAALRALHADIARPWSVRELAAIAGMSRSTFFLRFKSSVGTPPLDYLLRLRVHAAAQALRDTDDTVAAIAASVGYGAESAFSVAFKRVTGVAPGEYRHGDQRATGRAVRGV